MNSRSPRHETIAYLLAFLLALGLRLTRLGELPLTDSEAQLALDALQIAQGGSPVLSSHVAYTNLTAILFFLFGSFNFLARFWPALVGSALVFAPFLFREKISPRPALILAFFLAMDPAFVALSRQAGGPILALTASLFAVGFWMNRQPRAAGIFLALALLSGPALWLGVLALLLAWMLTQFLPARQSEVGTSSSETTELEPKPEIRPTSNFSPIKQYVPLLTATILTLLGTSTLLLLAPQGLGAWLASLPGFFSGWAAPPAVPVSRLLLALSVYQLLGILFAVAALLRGWWNADQHSIRLSLWMLVALLLALFYPARQTADLVWMLIPLWTLAALELSRHLDFGGEDRLETTGVMIFTVLLLAFAWMDLGALSITPIPSQQGTIRMLLFFGALLLLILSVVLVGFGWSGRIARVGAVWGVLIILGLHTFGAAWSATGLRNPNVIEPWNSSPRIVQADLLSQTADEISEWATGHTDDLGVTVYGVDSPALLWSLRNHDLDVPLVLDPASSPQLIITPPQEDLGLAAAYRGQDFAWRQTPVWDSMPVYFLRWFLFHELPASSETLVLWVRNDLFIDSESFQP